MCNCSADEVATKASSSERVAIISIYSSPINIVFWKLNWPKILKYDAQQSCQHCLAEISIQSQLTFELLRFLADLPSGLTKSASSGVEERTGDSGSCETWNKTDTWKLTIIKNCDCQFFRKSWNYFLWGKHCCAFSNFNTLLEQQFTFELRRVFADLSVGLTESTAVIGGEERRGDCETWNS